MNLLQSLESLVESTPMLDNILYLTMSYLTMVKEVIMLHKGGFSWPKVSTAPY